MKLNFLISADGMLFPSDEDTKAELKSIGIGQKVALDYNYSGKRTLQQNAALHLWMEMISESLNNSGLYISDILKFQTEWSPEKVKANIVHPIIKNLYDKTSTASLNKNEIDAMIDVITKAFSEKGFSIPEFPTEG